MRKDKNFKTYGRHKNRVITTDVWVSDNEKRKNVFSTSSEFDSSKQSSVFQLSSSGSEKSEGSSSLFVFESSKKARPTLKPSDNKENIYGTRKKNGVKKAENQHVYPSASSTDTSYEVEKKPTRRALRDRNKKLDYNDSANLKKQFKGTTAKRKRAVKVNNDKKAGESVNFSEFDEYSLVISDSPVAKNSKQTRQDLIETSTPVAKRTRCNDNTFEKIRNSDLSHIETVTSPLSNISYSVCTPASSLSNGLIGCPSEILSTPSIVSSLVVSDHNSENGLKNNADGVSESYHEVRTPENAVVQLDRLRESFILKHVSERKDRRKLLKPSCVALQAMTPEDVFVKLQRLTDSFINTQSNSAKLKGTNVESKASNNSLSLFESPFIVTRNQGIKDKKKSGHIKDKDKNSGIGDSKEIEIELEYDDDEEEEEEDEDYEVDSDDESACSSSEVDDLSAINEDEEEISEDADNEDNVNNSSKDDNELNELQNSMRDLMISDKSSGNYNETLYMLNNDCNTEGEAFDEISVTDDSGEDYEISGSRDLFSTNPGNSKVSLRSAKNFSKSDYFTASSSHVSEVDDYITADDDDDDCNVDDVNENSLDSPKAQVRNPYHLREKHLQSLQDSFKELLTPTKKKDSVVPLSARTKLLVLCDQSQPITFHEAIPQQMLSHCKKIGEGVYGEVFRTCSVALKIIPIEGDFLVNDEPQKKFEEILPEVVIAKELSSLRLCKTSMTSNFCEVKSVSLVKGKYPAKLLKEWDIFHKNKQSENDRPDMFTDNQLFILFEFADCGKDLESFEFENMHQAKSVLAQVVYALAVAEESLQFEHRDLHWGNVLVKPTDREDITYKLMGRRCSVPSMGVEANIIDFTLSRLTKDNCSVYIDLAEDDSLFEGKGDYQFDIYRKMKEENGNNWETFNPHSNVLWLHYLADKLVYAKRYPSQTGRQDRDILRQFRQFLGTIQEYQSACEMAIDAHFLNS